MIRKWHGAEKFQAQAMCIRDDFLEEMLYTLSHKCDGSSELIDKNETCSHEKVDLFKKAILQ